MSALILRDDRARDCSMTMRANAIKESLLEASALIGRVSSEDEQAAAVEIQRSIATVEKEIETARKECKQPVLDFGRRIDAAAETYLADIKAEKLRIARLVGNYQTELLAKQRAEESRQRAELAELDRKRQEELAKAQTHDQRDVINSRMDEEVKAAAPPIVQQRAEGQIVREEWRVQITNEFLLLRARPELVRKVEFDMVALKALLSAGERLPGVVAEKEVVSTVRAKTSQVVNV